MVAAIGYNTPTTDAQSVILVQFSPAELPQGRTAVMTVIANPDVVRMEAVFDGKQFPLYRTIDGDWAGLIAASMVIERGEQAVNILAWREGEERPDPPFPTTLNIVWGSFLYQDIAIPNALSDLLDPDLNRQEEELLLGHYGRYTREPLWTSPFQPPVPGPMISEFGGIRNYNSGVLEGRHTGTDYRAGLGDPAMASGNGRVVFANFTPIRGNQVVIDHGAGVLTGYSHLNEIFVVPGQRVLQGDVIGTVGATGRVQGAHMHFELAVNGEWVDPLQFLGLALPEFVRRSE